MVAVCKKEVRPPLKAESALFKRCLFLMRYVESAASCNVPVLAGHRVEIKAR